MTDAPLGSLSVTDDSVDEEPSDEQIEEAILQRWCGLTPIGEPALQTLAEPEAHTAVSWTNMQMLYDKDVKRYVATAKWKWVRQGFIKEETVTCVPNKIGGNDGVGIRFSKGDMNIIGKSATAWGNSAKNSYDDDFGTIDVSHSKVNERGVGFKAQDIAKRLNKDGSCKSGQYDYNMFNGSVVITFKSLNGCRNVQMYPGYVHSWDSASVNSIGAGLDGFSVGWVNEGDDWTREENGPTARICE